MPRKKRAPASKDITLRDVINHMEHHFMRMDDRFKHIDDQFGELERRIDRITTELAAFRKEFQAFAKGVDDRDERVQKIEDAHLPSRIERIERHIGLAA